MRKFCYFMYWLLLFGIVGFVITTIVLGVVIHPYYYFLFLMHIIIDPVAYVLACQFLQAANAYDPIAAEM